MHRGQDSRSRRDDYHQSSHEMAAREFDGTFDVKPQVYGTYGNDGDYPPPPPSQHTARDRDSQREYQAIDYRNHPDVRARYQPPASLEKEGGYRQPPRDRDYYPPPRGEEYERDYRRDVPPHRELPPPERGYDYRQPPPQSRAPAAYDRERDSDYDRGLPPPTARSERMYELPPPHERDYPPPSHYRGRSPPPMGAGYEHQAREREGEKQEIMLLCLSVWLHK